MAPTTNAAVSAGEYKQSLNKQDKKRLDERKSHARFDISFELTGTFMHANDDGDTTGKVKLGGGEDYETIILPVVSRTELSTKFFNAARLALSMSTTKRWPTSPSIKVQDSLDTIRAKVAGFWGILENDWKHVHTKQSETKDLSTRTMTTTYEHEYESKKLDFYSRSAYADPRIPPGRLEEGTPDKKAFTLVGMADGSPIRNVVIDDIFPAEHHTLIDTEEKWKRYLEGLSKSLNTILQEEAVLSTYKLEASEDDLDAEGDGLSPQVVEVLNFEGAHRLWELSYDSGTRMLLPRASLDVVMEGIIENKSVRVREACAAALWSMMPSQQCRRVLMELKLLPAFLQAVHAIDPTDNPELVVLLDRCLGAIAIMTVERDCRVIIREFESATNLLSDFAMRVPEVSEVEVLELMPTGDIMNASRDERAPGGDDSGGDEHHPIERTDKKMRRVLRQELAANALASMLIRESMTDSTSIINEKMAKVVASMCASDVKSVREAGVLTIGSFGDQIESWTDNFDHADAVDVMRASLKEAQECLEELQTLLEDEDSMTASKKKRAMSKKISFLDIVSKAVWVSSSIVFAQSVADAKADNVVHQLLGFVHTLRRLRASVSGTDTAISNFLFALTTLVSDEGIAQQAVTGHSEDRFMSLLEELETTPDGVPAEQRCAAILGILANIAQHSISEQVNHSGTALKGTLKGSYRDMLLSRSVFKSVLKLLVRLQESMSPASELMREISSALLMLLLTSVERVDDEDMFVILSMLENTSSPRTASNMMTSLWLVCRKETKHAMKTIAAFCARNSSEKCEAGTKDKDGDTDSVHHKDHRGKGRKDTSDETNDGALALGGDCSESPKVDALGCASPENPTIKSKGSHSGRDGTSELDDAEEKNKATSEGSPTRTAAFGEVKKEGEQKLEEVAARQAHEDATSMLASNLKSGNCGDDEADEDVGRSSVKEHQGATAEEVQEAVFSFMFSIGDRWLTSLLHKNLDMKHVEDTGCLLRFWVSALWLFLIPADPRPTMPSMLRSFTAAPVPAPVSKQSGAPSSPASWWGVELQKGSLGWDGNAAQLPASMRRVFEKVDDIITRLPRDETLDKVRSLSICLVRAFLSFYDEYDTSAYSSPLVQEKLLLCSRDGNETVLLRKHSMNLLLDLSLERLFVPIHALVDGLTLLMRSRDEELQVTGARGIAFVVYHAKTESLALAMEQTGIVKAAWKLLIASVRDWRQEVFSATAQVAQRKSGDMTTTTSMMMSGSSFSNNMARAAGQEEEARAETLMHRLEKLCIVLHAVVNLSILPPNQVKMGAGFGLMELVELRSEVQTRRMRLRVPIPIRSGLDDVNNMLGYLLANLQSHPLNRTSMYKAELAYSTKREQDSMRQGRYLGSMSEMNLDNSLMYKSDVRGSEGKMMPSFKTSENAAKFLNWMERTFPTESSLFTAGAAKAHSKTNTNTQMTAAAMAGSSASGGKAPSGPPILQQNICSSRSLLPEIPSVRSMGTHSSSLSEATASNRRRIRGFNVKMCRPFRSILGIPTNLNLTTCPNPWEPSISDYREENDVVQLPEIASKLLTASKPGDTTAKLSNAATALAEHSVSVDDVYHLTSDQETLLHLDNVDINRPVTPLDIVPLTLVKQTRTRHVGMLGMSTASGMDTTKEKDQTPMEPNMTQLSSNPGSPTKTTTAANEPSGDGSLQDDKSATGTGALAPMMSMSESGLDAHLGLDGGGPGGPGGSHSSNPRIKLKVNLQPTKARRCISFASNFDDGPGFHRFLRSNEVSPRLAIWEHVEGNKVYDNLFRKYNLPNGRSAYFYYRPGPITDKIEASIDAPLPRPTTLALVEFQQELYEDEHAESMRAAERSPCDLMDAGGIMDDDTIPLPHTETPVSFVHDDRIKSRPYCPQPRRPEAPITLPVDNRIRDMHSAKGSVLVECTVLTKVDETKEFKEMDAVKEPWKIQSSVFGPRKGESDSRSYFTTKELFNKMFSYEWEKLKNKNKFMNFLHRELKGFDAAVEIEKIRQYLKEQWQILIGVFMYYSAQSGVGIFRMNWNSFTCFVEECAISDQESRYCQRKDVDTLFIMCNFQEDKKLAVKQMNQENELMPFEFMEVLIRLAVQKYYKPELVPDVTQGIVKLIEEDVKPHLPEHVRQDQNDFRREYFYCEEMDEVARENSVLLKAIYKRYLMRPPQGGMRSTRMMFSPGYTEFINDSNLSCESLTIRDINLMFTVSKMPVANYVKDWDKHTSLSYLDFLEVIARISDYLSLPSYEQIREAEYDNVLEMFNDLERSTKTEDSLRIQRRESSYAQKGKDMSVHTRALDEKFTLVLDLIFRSLHETCVGGPYNADALLKCLERISHNM